MTGQDPDIVGRATPRTDAPEKVSGTARYTADLSYPGMLYAKLLYPETAHARLVSIDASRAEAMDGVVCVLTARDIPGSNSAGAAYGDQPVLVDDKVRHLGDGVALVVAESVEAAELAIREIEARYEPLAPVIDPLDALRPGSPLVHDDGSHGNSGNVMSERHYEKGDVDGAWGECDVVIEGTYQTQYQEHAFLETEGAVAIPEPDGSVTIVGSLQCPFYVRTAVSRALGLELGRVRVVQATVGGAFGGKEDVPNELCARAALAAVRTARPVMKVRTREESIRTHTKRHPYWMRHRLGARRDGTLVAVEMELVGDQGAYASVGPYVLFRTAMHATGPYRVPNARVDVKFVYTNNILTGAFRGFGQPQITFAIESQMDRLARELGIDPFEVRERNLVIEGDTSHTGHIWDRNTERGLKRTLAAAKRSSHWGKSLREVERFNKRSETVKRGLGLGLTAYGVGLGKEAVDTATSVVQILEDGHVTVAHGGVEMGQGANTALAMIAAQEIGVPVELVRVQITDTSKVQNSGPSVASRVTAIIGESVRLAAKEARRGLVEEAAVALGASARELASQIDDGKPVISVKADPERSIAYRDAVARAYRGKRQMIGVGHWRVPLDNVEGRDYHMYSPAAHVAEVEVDMETGMVTVLRVTAVNDVGRAINPQMVEGQIEGGVVQGMGLGVMEELVTRDGRILNPNLTDYLIPTFLDAPEIEPVVLEIKHGDGPFGAKGIGEPSLIPTPAAVANAVSHAIGKRIFRLPASPENVYATIQGWGDR